MADVTDATFEELVVKRSHEVPVVVDLWAPWCGPCRTLGPALEKVVDETGGQVELAKVNVDENPAVASAFRVQSIPAVYAVAEGKVVDSFIGALPEHQVREWVSGLVPEESEVDRLIAAGDEASLRQAVDLEPGNEQAVVALAELLVESGSGSDSGGSGGSGGSGSGSAEALELLARLPETAEVRRVAALARVGSTASAPPNEVTAELDTLLDRVKGDDEARQRFVDLLEVLGPDDPRTAHYRKQLTARLF